MIAVAIHVVVLLVLFGRPLAARFHPELGTLEATSADASEGRIVVKHVWHTHTLIVVDENYLPLDSARVRDLIGDRMIVTTRRGTATFAVRSDSMFMVRVTKPGFEPFLKRLPNEVSEAGQRTIMLHPVRVR